MERFGGNPVLQQPDDEVAMGLEVKNGAANGKLEEKNKPELGCRVNDLPPPCPNERNCTDLNCQLCDPFRPFQCQSGIFCRNVECRFLHPSEWRVCDKGVLCFEYECQLIHSNGRLSKCRKGASCINSDCEDLHPDEWLPMSSESEIESIKMHQRRVNREKAGLPMLACRDDFLTRLKLEKVLVVTAETGSGKTTQLPQYCAEEFPGLIVCTQPRVIAAMSVAQRIASEFDDSSVGINVGYEVGGGRKKKGCRIMIMTDAALIRMAQKDRLLKDVSVLMIDEAHERSLNTDIVVGIAKAMILQRPKDFRVVIASATIDPKPFLDFFFDSPDCELNPRPLTVPGRVFPVSLETRVTVNNIGGINSVLAEEVTKTLQEHNEGHCLVFLQGSREVDRAIESFKKIALPNWIPLPLYGALPPEEQNRIFTFDDQEGTLRMIIFCTNVAETSLTVPNVRVVIDTGLAKEARYDSSRRMTILEEVYISQSSADQRKGRAGRTAEGHCVRLFEWETLTRKNIQPEILRSSLDLVVLQVCSLNFKPLEFNFITRPDESLMHDSLVMLTDFGCLTDTLQLTKRGRLFNSLPFDPRLSHFVLLAHEAYNEGSAAVEIAAILSAPGSILFFGDSKSKDVKRDVGDPGEFKSDLMMLRSIYNSWQDAGAIGVENICCTCLKKIPSNMAKNNSGCRACRIKYSCSNKLNNKVLDIVRGMVAEVHKVIALQSAHIPSELSTISAQTLDDVIGVCLAQSFPEQVCEFIMPSDPTIGIYSIASDLKGQLSFSSVLRMPHIGAKHLIPMSVTKLPSGLLLMNQAHHIALEWLPEDFQQRAKDKALYMTECYRRVNISSRYFSHCRKFFLQDSQPSSRFAVCMYDVPNITLSVHAPLASHEEVRASCEEQVGYLLEEDLRQEMVADGFGGFATIIVTSGFAVKTIDTAQHSCRMHFLNPPVNSDAELLKWISEMTPCKPVDVKWHKFQPSYRVDGKNSKMGIVVFHKEELARAAQKKYASDGMGTKKAFEHGDFRVLVKTEEDHIKPLIEQTNLVKWWMRSPVKFQLHIISIPEQIGEEQLRALLRRPGIPQPTNLKCTRPENSMYKCFLDFQEPCSTFIPALTQIPELNTTFQIKIPSNDGPGSMREINVTTKFEEKTWPAEYLVTFRKMEEADEFYKEMFADFDIDGTATLLIRHPALFALTDHVKAIAKNNDVKVKLGRINKGGQEVIFFGGIPSSCSQAVKALKNVTDPMKYVFGTWDKRLMGTELLDTGTLEAWATELTLHVEKVYNKQGHFIGIRLGGERYGQGQFMARLSTYYKDFLTRYHLLNLTPSACCLFRKGCPGDKALKKLIRTGDLDGVQITFRDFLSSIDIIVAPTAKCSPSAVISDCTGAIDEFLNGFQQKSTVCKKCVYCRMRSGSPFSICGHPYCKDCLQQVIETQVENLPVINRMQRSEAEKLEEMLRTRIKNCPVCETTISIRDLAFCLSKVSQEKVCTAIAKLYLKISDGHPFALCPSPNCDGLVLKVKGYSRCHACSKNVCPLCGVIEDERHFDRSCEAFVERATSSYVPLDDLYRSAEKFARDHWKENHKVIGEITGVEMNPGLKDGCKALLKYCDGIKRLNLEDLAASSIFAWHGTSGSAVAAICNEGFDPKRRSGQAHGRGEYFGQSADVSVGYAKGCNLLIVAQLIKCDKMSKHSNFCYVVDNPVDWSCAFNLPVLVVAFGSSAPPTIDFILTERQPLPPPFSPPTAPCLPPSVTSQYSSSVHRWHWTNDKGGFEPYSDSLNVTIESHYQAYRQNCSFSTFTTEPITRNNDNASQGYKIDFVANTQTNLKTGYIRNVSRILDGASQLLPSNLNQYTASYSPPSVTSQYSSSAHRWHWTNDNGGFEPYSDSLNVTIESHYQAYRQNCGSSSFTTEPITRNNDNARQGYKIDFEKNTQTNLKTGYIRNVSRILDGALTN